MSSDRLIRRRSLSGLALTALLAMAISPAGASTFLREDVSSLARSSEAVVAARVVAMDSAWNEDHTMIFTAVTLEVSRRLLGEATDEITVRVPGGTVDGYTALMIGAPEFQMGDRVVVFLSRWDDGAPMVNGYFQGLSKVVPDQAGNLMLHGGAADGRSVSLLHRELNPAGR